MFLSVLQNKTPKNYSKVCYNGQFDGVKKKKNTYEVAAPLNLLLFFFYLDPPR